VRRDGAALYGVEAGRSLFHVASAAIDGSPAPNRAPSDLWNWCGRAGSGPISSLPLPRSASTTSSKTDWSASTPPLREAIAQRLPAAAPGVFPVNANQAAPLGAADRESRPPLALRAREPAARPNADRPVAARPTPRPLTANELQRTSATSRRDPARRSPPAVCESRGHSRRPIIAASRGPALQRP